MNTSLIIGIFEFLYSIAIVVLILWLSFRTFMSLTKGIDEIELIKKNNVAISILLSSFLGGIGIILYQTILPVISTFNTLIIRSQLNVIKCLYLCAIILIFLLISTVIGFLSIYFSIKLFCWLTKDIDEFQEIAKGNIAVSLILSTIIIIVSIFIGKGVASILIGFVPSPTLGVFKSM